MACKIVDIVPGKRIYLRPDYSLKDFFFNKIVQMIDFAIKFKHFYLLLQVFNLYILSSLFDIYTFDLLTTLFECFTNFLVRRINFDLKGLMSLVALDCFFNFIEISLILN